MGYTHPYHGRCPCCFDDVLVCEGDSLGHPDLRESQVACDRCRARLDIQWQARLTVACIEAQGCPCEECGAPLALWNQTDGVFADPRTFLTYATAQAAIKKFRRRYAAQGYYLTAGRERITPEAVDVRIVPCSGPIPS